MWLLGSCSLAVSGSITLEMARQAKSFRCEVAATRGVDDQLVAKFATTTTTASSTAKVLGTLTIGLDEPCVKHKSTQETGTRIEPQLLLEVGLIVAVPPLKQRVPGLLLRDGAACPPLCERTGEEVAGRVGGPSKVDAAIEFGAIAALKPQLLLRLLHGIRGAGQGIGATGMTPRACVLRCRHGPAPSRYVKVGRRIDWVGEDVRVPCRKAERVLVHERVHVE